jgi:hypothetical protein
LVRGEPRPVVLCGVRKIDGAVLVTISLPS